MLFNTPAFLIGFLPLCLAGYFVIGRRYGPKPALCWLTTANLAFYGWWNPVHLPLLATSVIGNYSIAWKIWHTPSPRVWLTAGIAANLLILAWFKYADFVLHVVAPNAPALHIALPLAISFFTFQQIMFLADAAHGTKVRADRAAARYRDPHYGIISKYALLPYAAFVTFFPHLIAGPIVRPAEVIPQMMAADAARPSRANMTDGVLIFLLGLGKKLVLADMFGGFADIGFNAANAGATLTFFEAWYAVLAYALQIYFDFSGYSDMAIGLARMMNIHFPLNFDSPYQATSIADFWRRWHITLGDFLRDYLYIPLGGNRVAPLRQAANMMVTMLLAGLWHGAAWSFVIWGGLHGAYLVIQVQYSRFYRKPPALLSQGLTLFAVILAWVPFRAGSLSGALAMLQGMAGSNGIALPRMIIFAMPPLAAVADPVAVLPFLGEARTLSFPEVTGCLLLGWLIVLTLPNIHRMGTRGRLWGLAASFALSIQALFFAPHVTPFLYFQF